ncbi:hypothetical protein BD289DRAFT_267904 [Coniella lustricola]|uniref:Uncharacterized protein n=1 Tax=Coniella lustricola TaxID=2025994 RepID=A0A2T3A702_9PEZI|nr:hypothetical protein BD289DRAFT_267904 [Coniella lustricola]
MERPTTAKNPLPWPFGAACVAFYAASETVCSSSRLNTWGWRRHILYQALLARTTVCLTVSLITVLDVARETLRNGPVLRLLRLCRMAKVVNGLTTLYSNTVDNRDSWRRHQKCSNCRHCLTRFIASYGVVGPLMMYLEAKWKFDAFSSGLLFRQGTDQVIDFPLPCL